jgi:hypothetical protein
MSRPADQIRYPIEPLLALMDGTPSEALARLKVSGSTQQEYLERGVSERVGDRLAIRAGLHPYVVWPEMADAVEIDGPTTLAEEQAARVDARRLKRNAQERARYAASAEQRAKKQAHNRRYYEECGEYVRAAERERYRRTATPEARRARYLARRDAALAWQRTYYREQQAKRVAA